MRTGQLNGFVFAAALLAAVAIAALEAPESVRANARWLLTAAAAPEAAANAGAIGNDPDAIDTRADRLTKTVP